MILDLSMRPALPLSPLLLLFTAIPGHAQPTPPLKEGPWAADADGDGRITREEMGAYMERRFSLMDSDGDCMIDRLEFTAPALAMFADRDINGDSILTAEELPQPSSWPED